MRLCGAEGRGSSDTRTCPRCRPYAYEVKFVEVAHARRYFGIKREHDLPRLEFRCADQNRTYRVCPTAGRSFGVAEQAAMAMARSFNEVQ